jgi:hypothetical protein
MFCSFYAMLCLVVKNQLCALQECMCYFHSEGGQAQCTFVLAVMGDYSDKDEWHKNEKHASSTWVTLQFWSVWSSGNSVIWMKNEIRMKHESLQSLKKMQLSKHREAKNSKSNFKTWKKICENYLHKDYSKTQIAKRHYVEYFSLLMIIIKKKFLKSCIVFLFKLSSFGFKFNTQVRKGLNIYNITNDTSTLRKHVNVGHFIIWKHWRGKEHVFGEEEKELAKKRQNIIRSSIFNFFATNKPFEKIIYNFFLGEDLRFLIVKNHLLL